MRTDVKLAYVSPEFVGKQITLEQHFCDASKFKQDDPIVEDGHTTVQTTQQEGFDTENKGFVDLTFSN